MRSMPRSSRTSSAGAPPRASRAGLPRRCSGISPTSRGGARSSSAAIRRRASACCRSPAASPEQLWSERGIPYREPQLVLAVRALEDANLGVAVGGLGPGQPHLAIADASGRLGRARLQQALQHLIVPVLLHRNNSITRG